MIPKIIHYCWFGNNPKPLNVLDNINNWKKKLPDYSFIEWNDSNLQDINNLYVEQAYKCRKYAFVSDYFRLYALWNKGGIYLDTDVKVNKSFNEFLELDFFSCYENWKGIIHPISTATLGASKNNIFIKEIMDSYKNDSFIINNEPCLTTNVERITTILNKNGVISEPYNKFETLMISAKQIIFPSYFFCEKLEYYNNYCVHEFYASWKNESENLYKLKFKIGKKLKFVKLNGNDNSINILFNIKFKNKKYAIIVV